MERASETASELRRSVESYKAQASEASQARDAAVAEVEVLCHVAESNGAKLDQAEELRRTLEGQIGGLKQQLEALLTEREVDARSLDDFAAALQTAQAAHETADAISAELQARLLTNQLTN